MADKTADKKTGPTPDAPEAPVTDVPDPAADITMDDNGHDDDITSGKGAIRPAPARPGATLNPATVAINEASRRSEIERLRKERDALLEQLGDSGIDELPVLRASVDVLRTVAAKAGALGSPTRMSEGVRLDLEQHGFAVDPATGAALVLDRDSNNVTVTPRRGQVKHVDMPEEPDVHRESKA